MTDGATRRLALGAALSLAAASAAGAGADEQDLTIAFSGPPALTVTETADGQSEFFGTHAGVVDPDSPSFLAGAEVSCEFDGYTVDARASGRGFTTAEVVEGRCLFATPEGDTALAEWRCRTAATMTSHPRCEGKAVWVDGAGRFAGIRGEARFHTDQFLQPGEGTAHWRGSWSLPRLAALTH
jgi:hypothetical protein